jgi:hypothetical protein
LEIVVLWEVHDAGKIPRTTDDMLNKKGRRGSLANPIPPKFLPSLSSVMRRPGIAAIENLGFRSRF